MSERALRTLEAFETAKTRSDYRWAMELANELVVLEQMAIVDAIVEARKRCFQ